MSPKREELIERLKKLAQSEPPKNLSFGAMCYSPMGPSEYAIARVRCDDCGRETLTLSLDKFHPFCREYAFLMNERTNWARQLDESLENLFRARYAKNPTYRTYTTVLNPYGEMLVDYQNQLDRLKKSGLDAELELPDHCKTCWAGLDQPFHLRFRFDDSENQLRAELKSPEELERLAIFLEGKDRYTSSNDGETALQDYVPELSGFFDMPRLPFLCELYGIKSECDELADPADWQQMKKLTLHGPAISPGWFEVISTMTSLEELDLSDCPRLDPWRNSQVLKRLVNLRVLRLNRCSKLGNALEFLEHMPKLEILELAGIPKLHGQGVKVIGTLPCLRELVISGSELLFSGGLRFFVPSQCLEKLDIRGCSNLRKNALEYLLQIPNLKTLLADEPLQSAFESEKHSP